MTTFVLVHGAWHGSWCWQRVRRALQAEGHEVHTPTLTGLGERSHLLSRDVDLETHILDVVNLLRWEDLSDVVLCGHSYGGAVVTGVADRVPDRIRALVYLDAFVAESGQSLAQQSPEACQPAIEAANAFGEGWRIPPFPAAALNVNERDRAWVDRLCTAHPVASMMQSITLSKLRLPPGQVSYILATDSPLTESFRAFHDLAQTRGWRTHTVASGHDVMLDRPDEVVRLLHEVSLPT